MLPHVGVVKNGFRNVPEEAVSGWLQLTPDSATTDQYLWKQAQWLACCGVGGVSSAEPPGRGGS